MFKVASLFANTCSKTWTPLLDCSVDDLLIKQPPLFDQARRQMIDIANTSTIHTLLQHTPDLIVNWIKIGTVRWPQLRRYEVWCFSWQQINGLPCSMCRGAVLLECEVASTHMLDGGKQMLIEQNIAVVRSIHLYTRLDEYQIGATQDRYSNRHHYGFGDDVISS